MIKDDWDAWVFEKSGGSVQSFVRSWWDAVKVTAKAIFMALVVVPASLFWTSVFVHGERVQSGWFKAFEALVWKDLVWALMVLMMGVAILSVLWMAVAGHFSRTQKQALLVTKAQWADTIVDMTMEEEKNKKAHRPLVPSKEMEGEGVEERIEFLLSSGQEVAQQWLKQEADRQGRIEPSFHHNSH